MYHLPDQVIEWFVAQNCGVHISSKWLDLVKAHLRFT